MAEGVRAGGELDGRVGDAAGIDLGGVDECKGGQGEKGGGEEQAANPAAHGDLPGGLEKDTPVGGGRFVAEE